MKHLLSTAFHAMMKRHPPASTDAARARVDDLRAAMAALPPLPAEEASAAADWWLSVRRELRRLVAEHDPRAFIQWEPVQQTMFTGDASYVRGELASLKRSPQWGSRWRPALVEDVAGAPSRCRWHLAGSGNLVHHAYTLFEFERATGRPVESFSQVVEFGGGYGGMCRLFRRLGFAGDYAIVDFPEFAALQRYYLADVAAARPAVAAGRTTFVTDLADLPTLPVSDDGLLVALWSLSETSIAVREQVLAALDRVPNVLIAFQGQFREVDNRKFFADWTAARSDVNWAVQPPMPHMPDNYYLFGTRRKP